MPFDFYIPHLNMCIEYDGEQHYLPIYGNKCLKYVKSNDLIKTNFCKSNGIKLLRIPYWDADKIPQLLTEYVLSAYNKI
jgi:very-short-patch-repair endonuclease